MARRKYYYKGTLAGGVSGYSPNFVYKLGWNTEPSADFESKEPCGVGIHLAKTIFDADWYVKGAKEFYFAYPDKILGEDDTKIRTNRAFLMFRIPEGIINDYHLEWWEIQLDALNQTLGYKYQAHRRFKALDNKTYKRCKALIKKSTKGGKGNECIR